MKPTARIRAKIRAIVRRPEVMGLKLVEREQYFQTLETEEGQQMQHLCREYTLPRNDEGTRVRVWIRSKTRIGLGLNIKFASVVNNTVLKFKVHLCFKTTQFRGSEL